MPKEGLRAVEAKEYVGDLYLADIGCRPACTCVRRWESKWGRYSRQRISLSCLRPPRSQMLRRAAVESKGYQVRDASCYLKKARKGKGHAGF